MRVKVKTGGGSGEVVSDTARHVQVKGRLPPRRIQEIKNHETGDKNQVFILGSLLQFQYFGEPLSPRQSTKVA